MNDTDIFLLFGFIGIIAEVFYTGLLDGIKNKDPTLKATSYIWMYPIYGSAGIIIKYLHYIFFDYNILLRGMIYGVYIIAGEYITGTFLKYYTGKCPWHYTSKYSWQNVIRLDYLPIWITAGLAIEQLLLLIG